MFKTFLKTIVLSLLLIFISCNNSFNPFNPLPQDEPETAQAPADSSSLTWVTATGSFSVDSYFTDAALNADSSTGGRAAFPETISGITGLTYHVTAESTTGSLTSTGTVDTSNNTYTIGLAAGYTWQITIEIKNSSNDIIMSGGTEGTTDNPHITVSTSDPYVGISNPIILKPLMGTDNGFIELYVDCTGITESRTDWNLIVKLTKEGSDPVVTYTDGFSASGNNSVIYFEDIPAGIYTAELKLVNASSYPVYMDTQTINVYSNLTTRRWGAGGGAIVYDSGSSSYKYKITDAHLQEFALTTIWVGTTKVGTTEFTASAPNADGTGANGTFVRPYQTLQQAIDELPSFSSPKAFTINVTGAVHGSTTISDSDPKNVSSKASSITFTGTTGSGTDSISVSSGTVLSIETTAKIIIKKLTITGGTSCGISSSIAGAKLTLSTDAVVKGNSSNGYGGGVYLQGESDNKAVLVMESSAKISGNHGGNGGGLYLQNAILYMSGNSLIGDKLYNGSPVTSYATSAARSNYCTNTYGSGGAIYLDTGGEIWMGYTAPATGTNGVADDSFTGGMFYNYAPGDGGAINQNGGVIHIHKGDISFNATKVDGDGGAIYCNSSNLEIYMEGGTIKGNYADCGGAIYNSGKFYMTGGVIGGEEASYKNTANTAGGAIYQYGTFEVSGSAKVWPGSLKTNDVYICSNKLIKLANNINSSGNTSEAKMTLTPVSYARQKPILEGSSFINDNYEKFETSDSEWIVVPDGTNTARKGKLECPNLYVASTAATDSGRHSDISASPTSASLRQGTKTAPYNTITEAVEVCWCPLTDYHIKISGELKDIQQVIPYTVNNKANSITLEGYSSDNTKDIINRNLTSNPADDTGSALDLATTVPVTIKNLTIKGGYANGSTTATKRGGGIFVNNNGGGKLTLTTGAKITGNTASAGGGIYYSGSSDTNKATLIMNGNAEISGNIALSSGGGLQLYCTDFYMYGSAIIGDKTESFATSANNGHSNKAGNGGGIATSNDNILYIGYKETGEASDFTNGGGIRHNYAENYGGGIYLYGSDANINSGEISYNGTKTTSGGQGGGIYYHKNGKHNLVMTNGKIQGNKSYRGGGIYNESWNTADSAYASLTGGTISDNTCTNAGGAIYSNITYPQKESFRIGGSVSIPYGGALNNNDIYLANNYITIVSSLTNHAANNQIAISPSLYEYDRVCLSFLTTAGVFDFDAFKAEVPKFKTTASNGDAKYWGLNERWSEGRLSLSLNNFTRSSDIMSYGINWSNLSTSSTQTDSGDYIVYTGGGNYGVLKIAYYGMPGYDCDYYIEWLAFNGGTTRVTDNDQYTQTDQIANRVWGNYDIDGDGTADFKFETEEHNHYMIPQNNAKWIKIYQ